MQIERFQIKIERAKARANFLFDKSSPYKQKIVRDVSKYSRKQKHKEKWA